MRRLLITLFAAGLTLAACGGSDTKSTNASASNTTVAGAAVADSSGGGSSKYCGLEAKYSGLKDLNPTAGNADSIKATLETARTALKEAVAVAPTEIKADVRVLADAYDPFITALAKVNYDFTKVNFSDPAFAKLSSAEVQAAAQRVSDWAKTHCH
jgi:hypothetical protein